MAARRRWVLIAFGVAVMLVFIGIGAIIAVTAWFQQNLHVETRTERDAHTEFEAVRQKFGSRAPLLEIRDGRPHYTGQRDQTPSSTTKLETLHVLVWDPEDERLARVALPFWVLRMKSDPIEFSAYASGMDDEDVDLRPEDIEKYGPGIVLDTTSPNGERVLLWAQ
jgi:hypothetical protein